MATTPEETGNHSGLPDAENTDADYSQFSPLCKICRSIFDAKRDYGGCTIDLDQTVDQLSVSQETCHLCYVRWDAMHMYRNFSEPGHFKFSCDLEENTDLWAPYINLSFRIVAPMAEAPSESRPIEIFGLPSDDLQTPLRYPRSAFSVETFEKIQRWTGTCEKHHAICSDTVNTGYLPLRMIDLGANVKPEAAFESNTNVKPRLCYSRDIETTSPPPYVALSHCWGTSKPLRLLKSNHAGFLEEIPHEALPILFQDVMQIVARLGIRFVWIDSLCIIQDDELDWKTQAADMQNVYMNAWMTLVAARALNSRYSCFVTRSQFAGEPCRIQTPWFTRSKDMMYSSSPDTVNRGWDFSAADLWRREVELTLLSGRAWFVQERFLSRRLLIFANTQVMWCCAALSASESCPKLSSSSNNQLMWDKLIGTYSGCTLNILRPLHAQHHSNSFASEYVLEHWQKIVQDYSVRSLTYPDKDKLVAMSGIAQSFGSPTDFFAGHWATDTWSPYGLNWAVLGPENCTRDNVRAPSWSWASINGQVMTSRYDWHRGEFVARVLKTDVKLMDNEAPFGQVQPGGHLVLSTTLLTIRAHKRVQGSSVPYRWQLEGGMGSVKLYADTGAFSEQSTLTWAPLTQDNHDSIVGVVLVPQDGRGEYRRVGLLAFSCSTISYNGLTAWRNLVGRMTASQSEERFLSKELTRNPIRCPVNAEDKNQFNSDVVEAFLQPVWQYTIKIF